MTPVRTEPPPPGTAPARHLPGPAVPLNSGFPAVAHDGVLAAELLDVITRRNSRSFSVGSAPKRRRTSATDFPPAPAEPSPRFSR